MAGYNRIIIMGNLTRDPEYKQLTSGQAVCRLGLASNRQFKNKQSGNMVQEVCYIDVDVWGAQAESCRQYLQKGRPILIEGRLKFDTWEDQEGKNRNKHSIVADRVVFLGSGAGSEIEAGGDQESPNSGVRLDGARLDSDTVVDQALNKQINEVKARTQAKAAARSSAPKKQVAVPSDEAVATGAFADEPPFQDDLPF